MAQPETPNFSPIAHVIFGVIALVVMVALLRYRSYVGSAGKGAILLL